MRGTEDSLNAPWRAGTGSRFVMSGCLALLVIAWWQRGEDYLRPDQGLGYLLGIDGAAAMLLILAYSARKRVKALASRGSLQEWYRIHMILGIVGPILIILHSNFQLGSANSSIAMVSMLLVAGSGFVGRYIYLKIHYGLYGSRAELKELLLRLTQAESTARPLLEVFPEVLELLAAFEHRHTAPPKSSLSAIWRLLTVGARTKRLRRRCLARLDCVLYDERKATRRYIERLRRVVVFASWERLFRLWHAVHVPLFAMLILTAVVHVLAVHMY